MIKLISAFAAAAIFAAPAIASDHDGSAPTKGEIKLAKLLEGRVAGEPQRCVRTMRNQNLQVIDGTALVIGRGRTIYVNIPRDPVVLDDDDILVIRHSSGSSLCRLDWVESHEQYGHFYSGNILLNDFVPYTRVETGSEAETGEG